MKATYIKTKDRSYPITHCQFFADCVRYFSYDEDQIEDVIPNGEWTLEEVEIIVSTKTLDQHKNEEKNLKFHWQLANTRATEDAIKVYGKFDKDADKDVRIKYWENLRTYTVPLVKKYMYEYGYTLGETGFYKK